MTSIESVHFVKRVNDSSKKSPLLKVVNPIIKKYTGHRQGKIKKKLKFPKIFFDGHLKQKKTATPKLKTILPKTNPGNVILLEPELLPCALNFQKRKQKQVEAENACESNTSKTENDGSQLEYSPIKENSIILNTIKSKINSCNNNNNSNNIKNNKLKLMPNNNKKKIKCLKHIEASLGLLESDTSALKEKREQTFAENYLLRVQQRLEENDKNTYDQFIDLLCNFQGNNISVCDLYKKLKLLFSTQTDLIEDFVAFLTPEQALECGVFMDHLLLTAMADFLSMIDVYFAKSPHQIRKINATFESLASKSDVTTDSVMDSVLPLLKGNPVLKDYFTQLLPAMRPPDNFVFDYEEVEYSELNSDFSDDEDMTEMVRLPEVEDLYGGDCCPCMCHDDDHSRNHGQHCLSCSTKFINGKIFIQNGKFLRPARVAFNDYDVNYHRERLAPKLYPKRNKRKHRHHSVFKDNSSPTKSCNLSSDEFKSDVEEDEKARMKLPASKSPRANRKKSVSPKHCDRTSARPIPNETRNDALDVDDKFAVNRCLGVSFDNDDEDDLPAANVADPLPENDTRSAVTRFSSTTHSVFKSLELPRESPVDGVADFPKPVQLAAADKTERFSLVRSGMENETKFSVFFHAGGSRSPPVISIPEPVSPELPHFKSELSLLENVGDSEDSKGPPVASDHVQTNPSYFDNDLEFPKQLSPPERDALPWKIDEDRIILQTLQVEENCQQTFIKIAQNIPARSVEDIKRRFAQLMSILYEMKKKSADQ